MYDNINDAKADEFKKLNSYDLNLMINMICFTFDTSIVFNDPIDIKVDVNFQTMSKILSEIGGMMKVILSTATLLFSSFFFNIVLKNIASNIKKNQ